MHLLVRCQAPSTSSTSSVSRSLPKKTWKRGKWRPLRGDDCGNLAVEVQTSFCSYLCLKDCLWSVTVPETNNLRHEAAPCFLNSFPRRVTFAPCRPIAVPRARNQRQRRQRVTAESRWNRESFKARWPMMGRRMFTYLSSCIGIYIYLYLPACLSSYIRIYISICIIYLHLVRNGQHRNKIN